jgi:8-oxo-dGTP pyrophosphatase MutT (NUDIX family)
VVPTRPGASGARCPGRAGPVTGRAARQVRPAPAQAAAREVEETGWRPGPVRLLVASQPSTGSVDSTHYLFRADGARHVGPPSDRTEADRIEWRPLAGIPALIDRGAIVSGPTLIALLYLLTTRELPSGDTGCQPPAGAVTAPLISRDGRLPGRAPRRG